MTLVDSTSDRLPSVKTNEAGSGSVFSGTPFVFTSSGPLERHGIPLVIPKDQLYYWTGEWREGVRAARDALANGDYRDFDSDDPNDVVRWLLDTDDS
jgi:hypothetical protein